MPSWPIIIAILAAILLLTILTLGFIKARCYFLERWVPALLTGLFLVGILPLANHAYWMRRQNFENCVEDRSKRYELVGSTAKTYTMLFKTHTRLYRLTEEISQAEKSIKILKAQKKGETNIIQTNTTHLATLHALRVDLGDCGKGDVVKLFKYF